MKGEEEEEGKEMTWGEKKKVLTQRKRRSVDRRGERERERSYVTWPNVCGHLSVVPTCDRRTLLPTLFWEGLQPDFKRFAPIQPVFVLQRMQKGFVGVGVLFQAPVR